MDAPNWEFLLSEQVRLNSRLFYQLAYDVLREDAAAQDVCQQAFMQAWAHRSKLDPSGKTLKRWISRTVWTECLQRVRRGNIERRVMATHAANRPQLAPDPWAGDDLREAVAAAVAALSEPARSIVRLKYMDGLSSKEISAALNRSESDLWRHLQEALEQLRQYLSADWRDDREP